MRACVCVCVCVCGQRDKGWKARKRECQKVACAHIPALENDNCVNECTSPDCFQQVYGAEPVRVLVRVAMARAELTLRRVWIVGNSWSRVKWIQSATGNSRSVCERKRAATPSAGHKSVWRRSERNGRHRRHHKVPLLSSHVNIPMN